MKRIEETGDNKEQLNRCVKKAGGIFYQIWWNHKKIKGFKIIKDEMDVSAISFTKTRFFDIDTIFFHIGWYALTDPVFWYLIIDESITLDDVEKILNTVKVPEVKDERPKKYFNKQNGEK